MKNCTCNKLNCDDTCLCACHRDFDDLDLVELTAELCNGLDRIDETIDDFMDRVGTDLAIEQGYFRTEI